MPTQTPKLIPDRDRWRKWYLDEDIKISLSNGDVLLITKGYRTNLHSVPLVFRWLFKRYDDKDIIAALAHDYLLDTAPWHRYDRRSIDNVYKALMDIHATPLRRFWMPLAVRAWGFLFYYWRDNKPTARKYQTIIKVTVENMVK